MNRSKEEKLERIRRAKKACWPVEVRPLVRDVDLQNIPGNVAYRVDGVHIYVGLLGVDEILRGKETEEKHRKLLRFLHVYQRVAHLDLFSVADALKVDFQNERLHFVVYKPYGDDERGRVVHAVALADAFRTAVAVANELHEELPDLGVSIGVEAGIALAVNNGTRGDREPLFVGNPANHAAKLLGKAGIFLGERALDALGVKGSTDTALEDTVVSGCIEEADLELDEENLREAWEAELEDSEVAEFSFSRPTPPLKDLALDDLTPTNSRRLEAAFISADIDGFTAFVADAVENGKEAEAVRALHVIRKELRDVLQDFGGRKVRYVGDCVHGVLAEGTSQTTDLVETVESIALCAGGMQTSMQLIRDELTETKSLGLAIGIEVGPTSITRLGVQGNRDRCVAGRAVNEAIELQESAGRDETKLGARASEHASKAILESLRAPRADFRRVASFLANAGVPLARYGVPAPAPIVVPSRAHVRRS